MRIWSIPSPHQNVWHVVGIPIRAYAMCILVGVVVAVILAQRRWERVGGGRGQVADLAAISVPMGVVGGRIYHVITSPDDYFGAHGHLSNIPKVWQGGLGIWGGVTLGVFTAVWYCRRRGWSWREMMWAAVPTIPIAQAIGRLGNWFNQELYGGPTTLPWGLQIDPANRPPSSPFVATYHPTFLYELLWDLAIAAVLFRVSRRWAGAAGATRLVALYVTLYCLGRIWIEALRVDTAHLFLGLRINVWTSLVGIVAGGIFLLRHKHEAPAVVEDTDAEVSA